LGIVLVPQGLKNLQEGFAKISEAIDELENPDRPQSPAAFWRSFRSSRTFRAILLRIKEEVASALDDLGLLIAEAAFNVSKERALKRDCAFPGYYS
jgi:hypothetical protein